MHTCIREDTQKQISAFLVVGPLREGGSELNFPWKSFVWRYALFLNIPLFVPLDIFCPCFFYFISSLSVLISTKQDIIILWIISSLLDQWIHSDTMSDISMDGAEFQTTVLGCSTVLYILCPYDTPAPDVASVTRTKFWHPPVEVTQFWYPRSGFGALFRF